MRDLWDLWDLWDPIHRVFCNGDDDDGGDGGDDGDDGGDTGDGDDTSADTGDDSDDTGKSLDDDTGGGKSLDDDTGNTKSLDDDTGGPTKGLDDDTGGPTKGLDDDTGGPPQTAGEKAATFGGDARDPANYNAPGPEGQSLSDRIIAAAQAAMAGNIPGAEQPGQRFASTINDLFGPGHTILGVEVNGQPTPNPAAPGAPPAPAPGGRPAYDPGFFDPNFIGAQTRFTTGPLDQFAANQFNGQPSGQIVGGQPAPDPSQQQQTINQALKGDMTQYVDRTLKTDQGTPTFDSRWIGGTPTGAPPGPDPQVAQGPPAQDQPPAQRTPADREAPQSIPDTPGAPAGPSLQQLAGGYGGGYGGYRDRGGYPNHLSWLASMLQQYGPDSSAS